MMKLLVASILIFCLCDSINVEYAEKVYPNAEDRELNLIRALDTLKNMRLEAKDAMYNKKIEDHVHKKIDPACEYYSNSTKSSLT